MHLHAVFALCRKELGNNIEHVICEGLGFVTASRSTSTFRVQSLNVRGVLVDGCIPRSVFHTSGRCMSFTLRLLPFQTLGLAQAFDEEERSRGQISSEENESE